MGQQGLRVSLSSLATFPRDPEEERGWFSSGGAGLSPGCADWKVGHRGIAERQFWEEVGHPVGAKASWMFFSS